MSARAEPRVTKSETKPPKMNPLGEVLRPVTKPGVHRIFAKPYEDIVTHFRGHKPLLQEVVAYSIKEWKLPLGRAKEYVAFLIEKKAAKLTQDGDEKRLQF